MWFLALVTCVVTVQRVQIRANVRRVPNLTNSPSWVHSTVLASRAADLVFNQVARVLCFVHSPLPAVGRLAFTHGAHCLVAASLLCGALALPTRLACGLDSAAREVAAQRHHWNVNCTPSELTVQWRATVGSSSVRDFPGPLLASNLDLARELPRLSRFDPSAGCPSSYLSFFIELAVHLVSTWTEAVCHLAASFDNSSPAAIWFFAAASFVCLLRGFQFCRRLAFAAGAVAAAIAASPCFVATAAVLADPTELYTDSKSARDISYNPEQHSRMKHVLRRHFFVRDMVEEFEISVPFVRTADNWADFFTKPMKSAKEFTRMRAEIMNEPRDSLG